MKTETVLIDSITFDPANVRRHGEKNLAAIKASLNRFGQQKPIVVDADGVVRAGNGTLAAAKAIGWKEIKVVRSTLAGSEATAYAIADNRTAELAEWDDDALAQTLAALQIEDEDLAVATGFDVSDIDRLTAPDEVTEDEVPEPPVDPITKTGDLWILGDHRLLCGDSMDRDSISRLYQNEVVDFILTDPPYCSGGFQESSRTIGSTDATVGKKIARDNLTTEGLSNLIEASIGRLPCEGACYVFCDWRQIFAIRKSVEPLGYQYRALLIWDKGSPGMGGPWRHSYEMVYFGTKRKEPSIGESGDVLKVSRTGNELHTTQKPVELMALIISNTQGNTIADPFLGSGTTLIAAEQLGRKCYGMEISAAYCDVIVKRWETLTGKKATRG
jgi:DNA modification methylase